MRSLKSGSKKRDSLLPPGCKDLIDVLKGPTSKPSRATTYRVNHRIRAHKVRVIGEHGENLGIMPLADAMGLAQSQSRDLVEISPRAKPPVCRIVDYGKFRYELSKTGRKQK